MANIASAKKRARQAEKHRLHNQGFKSMFRTYLKKVVTAIETGDKDAASTAYREAVPVIDKMVSKGLIHRNKAARHKSRLNQHILDIKA
ncbi:MAG: 30S ribosomal protein S20 [Gammaproteobacteria bacterium]|nr:30S ribosomal protein S20 [Gammaproteobacteria bacterium]